MDSQGIDKSEKSDQRKIRGEDNTMKASSSIESDGDGKSTVVTRPMIVEGPPKGFRGFPDRFGASLARSLAISAPKIPTGAPMTLSAPKIPTGDPMTFASPMDIETDGSVNNPAPQKRRLTRTRTLTRTLKKSKSQMPLESLMTSAVNRRPSTGCVKTDGTKATRTSQNKVAETKTPTTGFADLPGVTPTTGPLKSAAPSKGSIKLSKGRPPLSGTSENEQTTKVAEPVHFGPSTSSHRFDDELNEQEALMFQPHNIELFLKKMKRKAMMIDSFIKDIESASAKNVHSGTSTPGPSAGVTPVPSAGPSAGPSSGPTPVPSGIGSDFANDTDHSMLFGELLSAKIKGKFLSEILDEYDEYLKKAKRYAEYYRRKGDILTAAILDALQ